MVLVFGLSFELPLLLVMLNFDRRPHRHAAWLGWWRGMIMGISSSRAVATPDAPTRSACSRWPGRSSSCTSWRVGFSLLNDRRRRRNDPDAELDDDEASELDLTPEAIGEIETVSAQPGPARAGGAASRRRGSTATTTSPERRRTPTGDADAAGAAP